MSKKIAILLSTYNGFEYLEQQVASILRQSNKDWHLYIRDDGSNDGTKTLINKLSTDPRISFLNKSYVKNVGTVKSFMNLLKNVDADYYMFCDQDDYWLPDKVRLTLQKMENVENTIGNKPVAVHTNLKVTDESLRPYRLYNTRPMWNDFLHILFNNCATGCTMMINQSLKEKINFSDLNYQYIFMHDWWLALIASCFGKIVYIDKPTILYRQHGSNVLGSLDGKKAKNYLNPVRRIVNQDYDLKELRKALKIIYEFNLEYVSNLVGESKEYLRKYSSLRTKSSFLYNLKLISQFPPKETSAKKTLLYESIMLRHPKQLKW